MGGPYIKLPPSCLFSLAGSRGKEYLFLCHTPCEFSSMASLSLSWSGSHFYTFPLPFDFRFEGDVKTRLGDWVIVFWLPRKLLLPPIICLFVCCIMFLSLCMSLSLCLLFSFFFFSFFFQVVSRAFVFRFISFVLYGSDHFDPMFIISDGRTLPLWWFVLAMKLARSLMTRHSASLSHSTFKRF